MARKTYTAEFKQKAVAMSQEPGITIKGASRKLGISAQMLARWIRDHKEYGERAFPGRGNVLLSPEQAEILRLRKEHEQLKEEVEILKKAATFFAREGR